MASAFVKALDFPDKVSGEIFNISCKRAIPLGRYLQVATERLGSKSKVRMVSVDELKKVYPGYNWGGLGFLMTHMCFDIGKAERTFGHAPRLTTEQGLLEALDRCESNGPF